MNTEQKYFNNEAKEIGDLLDVKDRKALANKFEVEDSYIRHLFSGGRKAKRGKAVEILKFAKVLAKINQTKEELV
jgi:hypothetical protein